MSVTRSPPPTASLLPLPSMAITKPLEGHDSDSEVSEGLEAGLSAASSQSNLSTKIKITKFTKGTKSLKPLDTKKRKRADTDEISKSEMMDILAAQQNRQEEKFDRILNCINDVKVSVDSISTKFEVANQRIKDLEEDRKHDKAEICDLKNQVETLQHMIRCTSLEIRNIPSSLRETKDDLKNIICKTAEVLEIPLQSSDIKDVYRANTKSASKPIIADFTTVSKKDNFLNSFKQFNKKHMQYKFCTEHLNVNGPRNLVYVSENLTHKERKLYYLAREFAKVHKYAFCWTSFGRIFLRKQEGSPQIRIFNEKDLEKLETE